MATSSGICIGGSGSLSGAFGAGQSFGGGARVRHICSRGGLGFVCGGRGFGEEVEGGRNGGL